MQISINTDIILNFLKENNLSNKEFCEICGIKLCHFKRIIFKASNVGRVPATVFVKIADVIGVKFSDIIRI